LEQNKFSKQVLHYAFQRTLYTILPGEKQIKNCQLKTAKM